MKKYQIIYADPPWNYKVYSKKGLGRSAESHYPTMSIEDICALPVGNLADKDCALFLWVTIPCLLEGLSVLKAWGFTYKTVGFVEMSRNVQSGNTQNLKSTVIQRSFPKWSVAERRKTAAASDQAAVCACAHSRYFAGGSPSGLRV